MKWYFKKIEKLLPSAKASYAIDAIVMAVLMFFCLVQAVYLKTYPEKADSSIPLFLVVSLLFFLEAATVYKSGMRTLAGGMAKRFVVALFGLPSFVHFYSGLKEEKFSNWLVATGRYFFGALLFQWKERPEMISGKDFCRGLMRLASLTSREVPKSEYWEYYRSLVSLGRSQCLPEEKGSIPILAELDAVVNLVGREAIIKNIADLNDQTWDNINKDIPYIIHQHGELLLMTFAKDLSWEFTSFEDCLDGYKKTKVFARYYERVNKFNRSVKDLKYFKAKEISLLLESKSSAREYVAEKYFRE